MKDIRHDQKSLIAFSSLTGHLVDLKYYLSVHKVVKLQLNLGSTWKTDENYFMSCYIIIWVWPSPLIALKIFLTRFVWFMSFSFDGIKLELYIYKTDWMCFTISSSYFSMTLILYGSFCEKNCTVLTYLCSVSFISTFYVSLHFQSWV